MCLFELKKVKKFFDALYDMDALYVMQVQYFLAIMVST